MKRRFRTMIRDRKTGEQCTIEVQVAVCDGFADKLAEDAMSKARSCLMWRTNPDYFSDSNTLAMVSAESHEEPIPAPADLRDRP